MSEKKAVQQVLPPEEFLPEEPSQHEANKMVRVLTGRRLKFTNRVFLVDHRILEFQTKNRPKIEFNQEARSLWLVEKDGYSDNVPIMEFPAGAIILSEENPDAEK